MKSKAVFLFVIALALSSSADDIPASKKLFTRRIHELKNLSFNEESQEFNCFLEKLGLQGVATDDRDFNPEDLDELTVKRVGEAMKIVDNICFIDQREFKRIREFSKNLSSNSTFINNLDCLKAELKLLEAELPELPGYDYGDIAGEECDSFRNPARFYKKYYDTAELKKCSLDEFMQTKFVRKTQLYGFVMPLSNLNWSQNEFEQYFAIFSKNFVKFLDNQLTCVLREIYE